MPLTECPDCGGVVSDSALTCPTCHRVMAVPAEDDPRTGRLFSWALAGLLLVAVLWLAARLVA